MTPLPRRLGVGVLAGFALAMSALSDEPAPRVIEAGGYVSATGRIESGGLLVIAGGVIRQVGGQAPPTGEITQYPQAVLCPGLVDCYGTLGVLGGVSERQSPLQAQAVARDVFNRHSTQLRAALAAGVTTFALVPGDDNLVGGRIAVCQTCGPDGSPRLLSEAGPLKLSLAPEVFKFDREPTSRAGALGMLRDALAAARGPIERPHGPAGQAPDRTVPSGPAGSSGPAESSGPAGPPSPDLRSSLPTDFAPGAEPWASFASGRVPGLIAVPSAADVSAALELAAEYKLRLVLAHTQDVRRIAADLPGRTAGVVVGPLDLSAGPRVAQAPALLARHGVPVAIAGGLPGAPADSLRIGAAVAARAGLAPEVARLAITSVPAELLGVGDQAGVLAAGRPADFVVFSGDPLDLRTRVLAVYIGGERVWAAEQQMGEP